MTRFLARRLLNYIVLLVLASFLTFTLTSVSFKPLDSLESRNPRPPQAAIDEERSTLEDITRKEGKPEQALPKIVEGRVNGYFKENVLLDQPFAKDPKKSVAQVAKDAGAQVTSFARFKVGV